MRPLLYALALGAMSCRPAPAPAPAPAGSEAPLPIVEEQAKDDWIVTLRPALETAGSLVAVAGDGAEFVTFGGVRVLMRGEEVAVADQVLAAQVVDIAGFDDGGYYFRSGGELFFASQFTGDLVRVRGPKHGVSIVVADGDVASCIDASGKAWVTTAKRPAEMTAAVSGVRWLVAVGKTPYALRDDGKVLRLERGGAATEIGPADCFEHLWDYDDVLYGSVGERWFAYRDDAWKSAPSPHDSKGSMLGGVNLDPNARLERARAAAIARYPDLVPYGRSMTAEAADGPCGRRSRRNENVQLCPDKSSRGDLESWGVHRRSADGWQRVDPAVTLLTETESNVVVDTEGNFVVLGFCGPADYDTLDDNFGVVPLCWSIDGRRQEVSFPRPEDELDPIDEEEGHQSAWIVDLAGVWRTWLLVDTYTGHRLLRLHEGGLTSEELFSERGRGTIVGGPWLADGELSAMVERDGQRNLVRTELGGETVVHPVPDGALQIARHSPDRWMAVGKTLGEAWGSTDGGEQWSSLTPKIDGDPKQVAIGPWAYCRDTGCAMPPLVWAAPEVLTDYRAPVHVVPVKPPPAPERPPRRRECP